MNECHDCSSSIKSTRGFPTKSIPLELLPAQPHRIQPQTARLRIHRGANLCLGPPPLGWVGFGHPPLPCCVGFEPRISARKASSHHGGCRQRWWPRPFTFSPPRSPRQAHGGSPSGLVARLQPKHPQRYFLLEGEVWLRATSRRSPYTRGPAKPSQVVTSSGDHSAR